MLMSHTDCAEQLLTLFIRQFSKLYGPSVFVYNVHNVMHFTDYICKYGTVDNVLAFVFENLLVKTVKLIRKPSMALMQLVHQLLEHIETYRCRHQHSVTSVHHCSNGHAVF